VCHTDALVEPLPGFKPMKAMASDIAEVDDATDDIGVRWSVPNRRRRIPQAGRSYRASEFSRTYLSIELTTDS
jgi:hypothetical protein